jgi:hypothetical protein
VKKSFIYMLAIMLPVLSLANQHHSLHTKSRLAWSCTDENVPGKSIEIFENSRGRANWLSAHFTEDGSTTVAVKQVHQALGPSDKLKPTAVKIGGMQVEDSSGILVDVDHGIADLNKAGGVATVIKPDGNLDLQVECNKSK